MQPLPVLTEAQLKLVEPLQPDGKALNPVVIDRLVAALPSLVVNVTLNELLDPTMTLMALLVDEVATILSFVVVAGAEEELAPPHAASIARFAAMAQRPSRFTVLIIGLSADVIESPPIHIELIERVPASHCLD